MGDQGISRAAQKKEARARRMEQEAALSRAAESAHMPDTDSTWRVKDAGRVVWGLPVGRDHITSAHDNSLIIERNVKVDGHFVKHSLLVSDDGSDYVIEDGGKPLEVGDEVEIVIRRKEA